MVGMRRRGSRAGRPAGTLACAAAAVVLLAAPSVAAGKSVNGFVGGQSQIDWAGLFTLPRDVAVFHGGDADASNDKLFTVEMVPSAGGTKRVQRLDGSGNPELVWGRDVVVAGAAGDAGSGFEVCDVALVAVQDCQEGSLGTGEGMFDNPTGVAVDQSSGRVFVLDRDNFRVQEFEPDGSFVRAWGWGVATGVNAFEVCTAGCQQGIAGDGVGQLGESAQDGAGIAVSPVDGDVFVADPANERVVRFDSDGTVDGPAIEADAQVAAGHPQQIAVDAGGVVYMSDSANASQVVRYDTNTASFLDPLPSPALLAAGSTRGLEVDPVTGNLLVARQAGATDNPYVAEISDPGGEIAPAGPPTAALADTHVFDIENPINSTHLRGLGYNPTDGNVYLAISPLNPEPALGTAFTGCEEINPNASTFLCTGLIALADGSPLVAGVGAPVDVGSVSASVVGTVDPGGGVARFVFEVSADGGSWVAASGPRYLAGSGPAGVAAELSGLEPNSFYRLRLRVSKQVGMDETEVVVSGEQVFLTDAEAPAVTTLGSAARTDSTVRLRGRVDPQGAATTYRFEWGLAGGSFDHRVPVPDGQAGAGNTAEIFTADVDGLQPETAYHYRVVATNFVGVSVGGPVVFSTRGAQDQPPLPERAFELVSPADKVGGQGVSQWYDGPGTHAFAGFATASGRFVSQGMLGSVLVDGAFSYASDASLDERTEGGWVHRPAVTRAAHGRQTTRFLSLRAASPDLSLTTWASNGGTLRLFEEYFGWEETGNAVVYARDWAGGWEPFGPTDDSQREGNDDGLVATAVLDDGSGLVGSSPLRGLAGPGDPSLGAAGGVFNVFLDDMSGGVSDSFPGEGVRSVLNVCTDGTVLPARDGAGVLGGRVCPEVGERQTVFVSGADGGSFTLDLAGETTAPIAFDAPPGAVAAALVGLPSLAPGDVEVFGGPPDMPGWPQPYVVVFAAALGDVDELTADGGALTGADPGVEVATVAGVSGLVDRRGGSVGRNNDRALDSVVARPAGGGLRVFFMAPDPDNIGVSPCAGVGDATTCPAQLFVAQLDADRQLEATRWIARSEVAGQDAALVGAASFEGASADGDRVLLRTSSPLTADDPNGASQVAGGVTGGAAQAVSTDLYLYDFPDDPAADLADGQLTRITAGPTGDADPNATSSGTNGASGAVRFASDDATRVYFTTAAPIPGVSLPDDGTITDPAGDRNTTDQANLYLYDANQIGDKRWRFIARLPRTSALGECATENWANGKALTEGPFDGTVSLAGGNCVHGTADGSFVTFWTDGRLVADDPDSVSGDVYGYDADRDELTRLSAPQGGLGGAYQCLAGTASAVPCYGDPGFGSVGTAGVASTPSVGGDRLAFFSSASRLVAGDTDGAYDVYQWRNGVLSLLTPGDSESDGAFYQGNDSTGDSVFFSTLDRLTWQDRDAVMDVYVARVGGGIPEPVPPPSCDALAGGCQGPGSGESVSPSDGAPAQGNPPPTAQRVFAVAVSRRARRMAARRGVLVVSVRSSATGRVRATVRARIGRRARPVGRAGKTVRAPGRTRVRIRLARPLRRVLAHRRRARIVVTVRQGDRTTRKRVTLGRGVR